MRVIWFLLLQTKLSKTFKTSLHYSLSKPPDDGKSKSFATYTKVNGRYLLK